MGTTHSTTSVPRFRPAQMVVANNRSRPELSKTGIVKNPVNVRRGSVRIAAGDLHFSFDAGVKCKFRIYFQVNEFLSDKRLPILASELEIIETAEFASGLDQGVSVKLPNPLPTVYVPGAQLYPVIIETVPLEHQEQVGEQELVAQLSYVTINDLKASVIKQKLRFGDRGYELHEIFGISDQSPSSKVGSDQDTGDINGTDCVICLSEPRDTTVLPCRHLCLCNHCADIMRLNTRKCPICRQPVSSMLQIDRDMPTSPPVSPKRTSI